MMSCKLLQPFCEQKQSDCDILEFLNAVLMLHQFYIAVVDVSNALKCQMIIAVPNSLHKQITQALK